MFLFKFLVNTLSCSFYNFYCKYQNHSFTLHFKVLFMNAQNESLQELQHIKKMMERSTKFSSLSGFSGIAAGICALAGIWFAIRTIAEWKSGHAGNPDAPLDELATQLLLIAIAT